MNLSAKGISDTIGIPTKYVWILWVILIIIVLIILSKSVKGIKRLFLNEESNETQLATRFNILLDRWFVNEGDVIELAKEVKDFNKVNNAYRRQYNESLYDKLQQKLNSDEFKQFMNIIDANKPYPGEMEPGVGESVAQSSYTQSKLESIADDCYEDFQKSDWWSGKNEKTWKEVEDMNTTDLKALESVFNNKYMGKEGKTFKDYLEDESFNVANVWSPTLYGLNNDLLGKL
jgi:hypothetical protein